MSSSRRKRRGQAVDTTTANVLKSRQADAHQLPAPDAPEPFDELESRIGKSSVRKFIETGILVAEAAPDADTRGQLYHIRPTVQRWLNAHLPDPDTTPCGNHTGVRNLGDGEFTCMDDACDCRLTREQAKEVLES